MKIKNYLLLLVTFICLSLFTSEAKAGFCYNNSSYCGGIMSEPDCGVSGALNYCEWDSGSGNCIFDNTKNCSGLSDNKCQDVAGCSYSKYEIITATADDNKLVDTLCNALKIVTGSGGKAFAAFAIISVGIGFFTGKVSWGLMIGVSAGIAAMFGAPTIVAALSGEDAIDCS